MNKLEPGKLIQGLTYGEYHDAPGFRAGYLRPMLESGAHLHAHLSSQSKETEALRFGKLFHKALENPERFMDLMVSEPEFVGKTKDGRDSTQSAEARQKKKDWYASLPKDALVVDADDRENIGGMMVAMGKHSLVRKIIKNGMREVSAAVRDPESGEMLKFRPDLINEQQYVVDYKSCGLHRSKPRYFIPELYRDDDRSRFYVLSGAHYSYCSKLLGMAKHDTFSYIAVEKVRPWGMHVYILSRNELAVGEEKRAQAMRAYAECKAKYGPDTANWPGYPEKAVPAIVPDWLMKEHPLDMNEEEEKPQW